jgi:diketogulonate reductase-like aldo/keto reductase
VKLTLQSTLDLGHGIAMPRLGLGTYKTAEGDEVRASVETALALGYRSIDTASLYGNEHGIGEALRASGLARDEVFLATKVWNDEQGYDETLAALGRSLERLGTAYVDLYLVHWPVRGKLESTWRAMEDALADGLTRAIGVCNHLPHHLEELLAIATTPPAVDQVEFHPWLQQPSLQAYLAEHDIALEAWAPLMKGRASEEPVLVQIAERLGVSPAQVAIRWILQQGYVTIPKSVHAERIAENADVFGFELTDRDVELIGTCDRGHRLGSDPDALAW